MATNPQTPPDTSQPAMSALQQQEANLAHTLEITPYELVVLEKHLLSHGWIPGTAHEDAVKEAVFNFRESFFAANCFKFHFRVDRLNTLFDAYPTDEEYFAPIDQSAEEAWARRLNRETTKYNAARSLIADLAVRESRKRPVGGDFGIGVLVEYVSGFLSWCTFTTARTSLIIETTGVGVLRHPGRFNPTAAQV